MHKAAEPIDGGWIDRVPPVPAPIELPPGVDTTKVITLGSSLQR
jgi:hypothetical protein